MMQRLITHFMIEGYHGGGEPVEVSNENTRHAVCEAFFEDDCEYWSTEIVESLHGEMDYPDECKISFYEGSELVCTCVVEARMEPVFYATEVPK